MDAIPGDVDELVEFWTLLDEDRALLSGKRGATGLGFALLLKHYSRYGRLPRGRSNVPDAVVRFVGRQIGVDSSELNLYEWSGRTIEYHRAQIRTHLGFRVATVDDQEKLTTWLAANVAHDERRLELVREELLARFRTERIEPPTSGRLLRMVRSALRTAEHNWAQRISERLDERTSGRLLNLIVVEEGGPETDGSEGANEPDTVLGLIKSMPGNVSLASMMTEIGKLQAVRAVGLPAGLFTDVAPKVLDEWRARASVEVGWSVNSPAVRCRLPRTSLRNHALRSEAVGAKSGNGDTRQGPQTGWVGTQIRMAPSPRFPQA